MSQVFISFASKDKDFARDTIKRVCDEAGLDGWLSATNLRSGADWERQIREALRVSRSFVVVMSPNAERSPWVQAETHWALENLAERVFPVMMRSCDPTSIHLRLGTLQYVDFRHDQAAACTQLISLLRESCQEKTHLPEAVDVSGSTLVNSMCLAEVVFDVSPPSGIAYELRAMITNSLSIGRGKTADIRILDQSVSRIHAHIHLRVEAGDALLYLEDAKSANGTVVSGHRVTDTTTLQLGDTIEMGATKLRFRELGRIGGARSRL